MSQEIMAKEYAESERKLNVLNNKHQNVTNRLNDHFRIKIESLNSHNVRTHEIKVKMNHYEEEK